MRKTLAAMAGVATLSVSWVAQAADHRDGMAVLADPATDINDVYTWMSPNGAKLYLVMTVFPFADTNAKFSDSAKYVFHLSSAAGFGTQSTDASVVCSFDATQKISCWVVSAAGAATAYVTGDASPMTGIVSTDAKLKVFAGLRDDPFFFNLDGFKAVTHAVGQAAATLTFDPAGCPTLDPATAGTLAGGLSHAPDGTGGIGTAPATNTFAGKNTLAIVVAVDKGLVTAGGPVVSVWASTNH